MNMKRKGKAPSSRSLDLAFKSFAMDASELELDAALTHADIKPNNLVSRADRAIDAALNVSRQSPTSSTPTLDHNVEVAFHKGLSALVRLLRRRDGLTESELAQAANVDVSEIRRIECDEEFTVSPRTIYQLEEYFKLPGRSLVLMSGSVIHRSAEFTGEVLRFAAHSEEMGKLNREEKKLLNSFVRFLTNELKKK